jgi:hypothetical protein
MLSCAALPLLFSTVSIKLKLYHQQRPSGVCFKPGQLFELVRPAVLIKYLSASNDAQLWRLFNATGSGGYYGALGASFGRV